MKKNTVLILLIGSFLTLPIFVCAQNFGRKKERLAIVAPEKFLKIGEELQYSVEWLGVRVGKIILKVEEIKNIDGHDCYHIIARAMPNKYLAKFYDVEYIVHTYIDKENFYTRRFEKIRRMEGKYNYVTIEFDREKKEVRFRTEGSAPLFDISGRRVQVGQSAPHTLKIINGTQDLFSSVYYIRLLEIKDDQSYTITIYYDRKNWPLHMKVGRPFYRDIRRKGTFAVFEASMNSDLSTFILGKSGMTVYFSADSRRIPLEFKFGTGMGSVRGIIQYISD